MQTSRSCMKNKFETGKKCVCKETIDWMTLPGSGKSKTEPPKRGDIFTISKIEFYEGVLYVAFKELKGDQFDSSLFRVLDDKFANSVLNKIIKSISKTESLKKLAKLRQAMLRNNKKK